MSEQELALGGMKVRRRFERSRLEEDLFEAVYDALLMGGVLQGLCGADRSESATEVRSAAASVAA
jgi:hypothetical protein